jgi:hypothetical protein
MRGRRSPAVISHWYRGAVRRPTSADSSAQRVPAQDERRGGEGSGEAVSDDAALGAASAKDPGFMTIAPIGIGISATGPVQNSSQDSLCMVRLPPSPGQQSCPGIVHPVPAVIEVICAAWVAFTTNPDRSARVIMIARSGRSLDLMSSRISERHPDGKPALFTPA